MDMKLARKYAALTLRKRKAQDELDRVKEEMKALEEPLLNMMAEEQLPSLKLTIDGEGVTIYPQTQLWVRPLSGDREAVVGALRRAGLKEFTKLDYNTSTVSAWARERLAEGKQLPPSIEKVVQLDEVISLRGRRTPASPESSSAKAIKTARR